MACVLLLSLSMALTTSPDPPPVEPISAEASVREQRMRGVSSTRYEYGVFPAVSYDSDEGFHFGTQAMLVRYEPGFNPHRYLFQVHVGASVRPGPDGEAEFPTHDDTVLLDFPDLLRDVRVRLEAGYRREVAQYFGLGNDSAAPSEDGSPRRAQYDREYPFTALAARVTLPHDLFLTVGFGFSYSAIEVFEDSALERERQAPASAYAARALRGVDDHAMLTSHISLEWDTRDHEVVPSAGMHHSLTAEGATYGDMDQSFGKVHARLRGFIPLVSDYLVLAARADVSLSFGLPTFYALPKLGGSKLLRGVQAGRYHGRARVLASVELRSMFLPFRLWGQRLTPGVVTFFDAGRVFADYEARPDLDGDGAGIHWGAGAGARLLWGESMLLRVDFGASMSEIGLYLGMDHAF